MALTLNGFDVLARIGANPQAFGELGPDVLQIAEKLIRKQLKSRALDLDNYRRMAKALGEDSIALVLQTLNAGELRALLRQIDPANASTGSISDAVAFTHLMILTSTQKKSQAAGARQAACTADQQTRKSRRVNILGSASMGVKRAY